MPRWARLDTLEPAAFYGFKLVLTHRQHNRSRRGGAYWRSFSSQIDTNRTTRRGSRQIGESDVIIRPVRCDRRSPCGFLRASSAWSKHSAHNRRRKINPYQRKRRSCAARACSSNRPDSRGIPWRRGYRRCGVGRVRLASLESLCVALCVSSRPHCTDIYPGRRRRGLGTAEAARR